MLIVTRMVFSGRWITAAMLLFVLAAAGVTPLAAQPVRLDQAADVARAIESPDARVAALARVGHHAADAGQAESAGRFFVDAAEIAGNIEDSEDRFWARMQIALAQRQAGMAQAADETSRAALAEATTNMPPPDRARLLSVAVQDLFEAGLVDEALALNRQVRDPYRRDQNFRGIARGLLEDGDLDGSLSAAVGIEEARPREMMLTRVMYLALGEDMLGLAAQAAEAMPGDEAEDRAMRSVAVVRAVGKGEIDARLPDLLAAAPDKTAGVELLADVVAAQARSGDADAAASTLQRAVVMAAEIAEAERRARALELLAPAAALSGDSDAVFAIIHELPVQSFERNSAIRLSVSELLAEARFEDARRLADLFDHPPHRAQLYTQIAVAMTEAGEVDAALALLEGMEPARMRARALGDMVEAAAMTGNVDAAARIADRIEDPLSATVARSDLAQAHVQAGDLEDARAIIEELDNDAYRQSVLRHIAIAEADAGRLDAAAETASQLTHERYRPEALIRLARAQAAAGQVETARQTAAKLEEGEARETALTAVAEALARSAAES